MKLLVVVVSYRVTELTVKCLRSLSHEVGKPTDFRVAVCENGTGGDAESRLRGAVVENGWSSWVTITAIYPNRGFTGGNNAVIEPALQSVDPPEYVLLLNSDTTVHADALEALVDFMDAQPRAGIAGSQLIRPDGTVESSPFRFPGIVSEFDGAFRLGIVSKLLSPWAGILPKPAGAFRAGWVSGASLIVRRAVLEQVGLLDEGLYTYFDDIDLCLRAARAGWETWYVPASKVVHLGGASTGLSGDHVQKRRLAYWFEARRRFFLKSYGRVYTMLVDAAFLAGFAAWRIRRLIQRKVDTDPPHMLIDSLKQSVFCAGFRVPVVENPAIRGSGGQAAGEPSP
jgi:N-acetylglucosaminyl-diphospho-decaprenol L-rhamnosyltransferase